MHVFLSALSPSYFRRQIKGYWYIGALVETWETDHLVACKFARTPVSSARATKVVVSGSYASEHAKEVKKDAKNTLKRSPRSYNLLQR